MRFANINLALAMPRCRCYTSNRWCRATAIRAALANTLLRSLLIVFVAFCISSTGQAASYECAKAVSQIEKMICGDPQLSTLDDTLGIAYRDANEHANVNTREQLKRDQRSWIRNRNICRDQQCVKSAYEARILELKRIVSTQREEMAQVSTQTKNEDSVCNFVANMANIGKLSDVVLKSHSKDDSSFPTPDDIGYTVFRNKVDINNDGRPEYVYITSDGTAHFESLVAYDSNLARMEFTTSSEDDWESDKLRWSTDRMVINYKGSHYVIGKSNEYLNYISKIAPDNVEKVLCDFGQKEAPLTRLVVSNDKAVCDAALKGGLTYEKFDKPHTVTAQELRRAGIEETDIGEKAAKIDFDNDGRPENVTITMLESGRGPGCSSRGLIQLNDTRSALVNSAIAILLRDTGDTCGGTGLLPFRIKGKTYLELKYAETHPSNVHFVYKIENGKRETVCELEARVINYVSNQYDKMSPYDLMIHAAKVSQKNPWEYALQQPGLNAAELLIENGWDVNGNVFKEMSLLNWAVWQKRNDLLELLLNHSADPNKEHDRQLSPLYEAIWHGTNESVILLLKRGAQLKIENSDPIMLAVQINAIEKLKIVIGAGIHPEPKHMEYARSNPNTRPEVIQFLQSELTR